MFHLLMRDTTLNLSRRRTPRGGIIAGGSASEARVDRVREAEDQLRAHPAVDDVCVIGVPHDIVGEPVCACVVPVEGVVITDEGVEKFARHTVADYTTPSS